MKLSALRVAAPRALAFAGLPVLVALALSACQKGALGGDSSDKDAPKSVARPAGSTVETQYGTPVKDRVATLGIINKRNNLTQHRAQTTLRLLGLRITQQTRQRKPLQTYLNLIKINVMLLPATTNF